MTHFASSFLTRKTLKRVLPFGITLAVLALAYLLPQGDLRTLLLYAVLIPVFSIYRFDSRILIGCAIILLVIGAVLISQKADETVKRLAILSYWFLVAGIICILIDFYRKKPIQNQEEIA